MKKSKILFSALMAMLTISGCSTSKQENLQQHSMTSTSLGFDTVVMFTAYTQDEKTYQKYEDMVKEEFLRYDKLFSKYKDYEGIHNIKTINDNAGKQPVKVDAEILDLLEEAKHYDALSNHQFSVTMGAVLDIWHDYREEATQDAKKARIPSMDELKKADTYTGWEHVSIDKDKQTVYLKDKSTQLDVGAIAKGYAVEKIAEKLEAAGLEHAILNGGGNVRLIGNKPEQSSWSVGLQIPNYSTLSTDSLLSVKIDHSASFVTSGDYQRYYTYQDQILHHIIDPTTLMPARHCRSVTIITEDGGIADMLSTTLFTMSHKDGVKLLEKLKAEEGIEAEAIWVYDDKVKPEDDSETISSQGYQIVMTAGVKNMLKES